MDRRFLRGLTAAMAAVMLTVTVPAEQPVLQTTTIVHECDASKGTTMYVTKSTYSYKKKSGKYVKSKKLKKGAKLTVTGSSGKYYKLSDGKYVKKSCVGSKRINWTDTKYSKALTRYIKADGTKVYEEALSGSKSVKTLSKGTKVTITAKSNSGYYRLKDGGYIKTSAVTKTKPSGGSSGGSSDTTSFRPSGNAGTVSFLGYYDITLDAKSKLATGIFQSSQYGGNIEINMSSAGSAYFEKLAVLISADDSPDLVTYEPLSVPYAAGKNMYTKLDSYIDINDALWRDMKDVIKQYTYNGSNYYFPTMVSTGYALNYNRKTIEAAELPDPYELYRSGNWTWDTWRDMMTTFCNQSDDNIGMYHTSTMTSGFINSTGTAVMGLTSKGGLSNGLNDYNVTRTMDFLSKLGDEGLLYPESAPFGDWVSPQMWASAGTSDKLLFLCMDPEWSYVSATETVQNKPGVENDIFNTVSDYAFVPIPKDPEADKYYHSAGSFGYLVPKGAKNVKGAVEFINLSRICVTDPTFVKQDRQDHISPTPVTYMSGKYEGSQKWCITWDEDMYDLLRDMRDPDKFELVFDFMFGMGDEVSYLICDTMYDCTNHGESWSEKVSEISPVVDAYIAEL